MSLRAPKHIIESLRLILQHLEQTVDPGQNLEDRVELNRILRLRIATLEAIEALRAGVLPAAARKASEPTEPKTAPRSQRQLPQPTPSAEATAPLLEEQPFPAVSPS